ncbi:MAG: DUF2520 domain-containing protein [Chlorobi bacterium]|nr:DUF2520 domain-containing protein [Chlorobiota bacterium]
MNIILIGSGNVAFHLGLVLSKKHNIVQIYSRNTENATELAQLTSSVPVNDPDKIDRNADFYLIAVSDDAIKPVTELMPLVKGIVVHTSGSTDMNILNRFKNYGVMYPFQTFTKERKVDFKAIPVLVEGNTTESLNTLIQIAESISDKVSVINSEQRAMLHIAAVFASNFVNHLFVTAKQILKNVDINFDILYPLILETAKKATEIDPEKAQTGPAVRNDTKILKQHTEILNNIVNDEKLADLYKLLSERILSQSKQN